MYQEPECFRKTTDKYTEFCTERKQMYCIQKKKTSLQRKPAMLRCYRAFNLVPSPSSNKILWPSCDLECICLCGSTSRALRRCRIVSKVETEAETMDKHQNSTGNPVPGQQSVSNDISKCYKSAGCSMATSLPTSSFGLKNNPSKKRLLQ